MSEYTATYQITWVGEWSKIKPPEKDLDEEQNIRDLLLDGIGYPDGVDVIVEKLENDNA